MTRSRTGRTLPLNTSSGSDCWWRSGLSHGTRGRAVKLADSSFGCFDPERANRAIADQREGAGGRIADVLKLNRQLQTAGEQYPLFDDREHALAHHVDLVVEPDQWSLRVAADRGARGHPDVAHETVAQKDRLPGGGVELRGEVEHLVLRPDEPDGRVVEVVAAEQAAKLLRQMALDG